MFDEVASGLGELGALVANYHHAAVRVAENAATRRPGAARRRAASSSRSATAGGSSRRSRPSSPGCRCRPIVRCASCPAGGGGACCWQGARRREPDLLLLDEPTNHLDIDAIRWLEDFLRELRRRAACSSPTIARSCSASRRASSSSTAAGSRRGRATTRTYPAEEGRSAGMREARRTAQFDKKLARGRGVAAAGRQGAAHPQRGPGAGADGDARGARRAARRRSATCGMTIDAGRDVRASWSSRPSTSASRYGGSAVIRDFSQRILRGDRVGLIGPNGSGKTTLLRLLLGELAAGRGRRSRAAPTCRSPTSISSANSSIRSRPSLDTVNDGNDTVVVNGQPRHVHRLPAATSCSRRERAQSPVKALSGGERNRLLLARLFTRPANVLVLDEPTNDLDIETLELLEELLGGVRRHGAARQPRPRLPRQRRHQHARLRRRRPRRRVRRRLRGLPAPVRRHPEGRSQGKRHAHSIECANPCLVRQSAGPPPLRRSCRTAKCASSPICRPASRRSRGSRRDCRPKRQRRTSTRRPPNRIREVLAPIEAIGPELEAAVAKWLQLEDRA